MRLYVTDNKNDAILRSFWENVVLDARNKSLNHLEDNPFYSFNMLYKLNFEYAILWLKDNEPVYGWLAIRYPNIPNVIRFFTRMYSLDTLSIRFMKQEHKTYKKILKPMLDEKGIDTIFFTRHSISSDRDKWKNPRAVSMIMGNDIKIKHVDDFMFRGVKQTIYYYTAWTNEEPSSNFLNDLRIQA